MTHFVHMNTQKWLVLKKSDICSGSSLIYNTSDRHERHKCNTSATLATRVQHEFGTSHNSATQVQHECTLTTRVRHKCYTKDASATLVKHFDFVTRRVKTYFRTLIFAIWQVKDYKERNNFILRTTSRKCLFSMPKCV